LLTIRSLLRFVMPVTDRYGARFFTSLGSGASCPKTLSIEKQAAFRNPGSRSASVLAYTLSPLPKSWRGPSLKWVPEFAT
jgi:hypothetical protein